MVNAQVDHHPLARATETSPKRRSGHLSCLRARPHDLADAPRTRPRVVSVFVSTVPFVYSKRAAWTREASSRVIDDRTFCGRYEPTSCGRSYCTLMCCVRRLLALVVTDNKNTLKTTKQVCTKCTKGFTTLSPLAGSVLDPPSAIAGLGAAYVRDARLQNLVDQRRSGTSVAEGAGRAPPRRSKAARGRLEAVEAGPRRSRAGRAVWPCCGTARC